MNLNSLSGAPTRGPAGRSSGNNRAGSNFSGDIIPKGYRAGQLAQFDPQQTELYSGLFSHLGPESYLSRLAGGDPSLFEDIEAPAQRQFQELQGGLASRFSGLGLGGRHGSGFQNAANQQTIDFATQLQSNRQNLQRQGMRDLFELSNLLLGQRPYERNLIEKQRKPGFGEQLLGVAGSFLGGAAGGFGSGAGTSFGQSLFGG